MPSMTKSCKQCGQDFSGEAFGMRRRTFCSSACYTASHTMDLAGQRFGRLVALERIDKKRWRSACDCGGEAASSTQNLVSGKARSCGCLNREISAVTSRRHGGHGTRAYQVWDAMLQRTTNPKTKQFSDYGGRGISVCAVWLDFANFLADMGQPPDGYSLERTNNDLGYCKDNCEWATRTAQQRNRRVNRMISYNGEVKCLAEWAEQFSLTSKVITGRLNAGWSMDEVFGVAPRVTPVRTSYIRSDARWVEFDGKRMIFSEWCRELGVNPKSAGSRLARGASNLQALGLAPMEKS